MKFNFRKIGSVLASAAMLGSTIGIAAAASYPGAFTSGAGSDVAIVVGRAAAQSDFVAATDIGSNLNSAITASTATSGGEVTTSGETYALFSSSSPIFINKSISSVRDTVTKNDLPTVLADQDFEGIVSAELTHNIRIGTAIDYPRVVFSQQPSGDDDPQIGIALASSCSSGSCKYLYNATIDFDEATDMTNASSEGEDIKLFGQKFTVASATSSTKLILLKSSVSLDLSVGGPNPNPSQIVTIEGKTYTVELAAATDTAATVKITDSEGNSDRKEISEAASKKIRGLEVSVNTADESTATNMLSAEVLVGSSKFTLQDGNAVKVGTDEDILDGTNVEFGGANNDQTINLTKITLQVVAEDSDEDAITPGQSFVDPVFGTFKIDFPGLNIGDDDPSREEVLVKNSGGEKMTVQFTTHEDDDTGSFSWVYNKSDSHGGGDTLESISAGAANGFDAAMDLAYDNNQRIVVAERGNVNRSEYVVLGNEDDGGLFEINGITNATTGYSDDQVTIKNVFSGDSNTYTATSEGVVTATLLGRSYTANYYGANSLPGESKYVRIDQPDSSGNDMVLYPTIETAKGAKLMFYEPLLINLSNWNGAGLTNVSNFKIPNGNGYTTIAVGGHGGPTTSGRGIINATIGGTNHINLSTDTPFNYSQTVAVGQLTFNFTGAGTLTAGIVGTITVYLFDDTDLANIIRPAIVVFEEKDDQSNYEAIIIELDAGYDGDAAGVGVTEVTRTWGDDNAQSAGFNNEIQLESDTDLYQEMDWWGSLITLDKSDSDQVTATISYPDDQVFAQVYISAAGAVVSTGGGVAANIVPVYDDETTRIANKNLIVVGGSCINTIAAELLGSTAPLCEAGFTTATGVGAGQYLIETFSRAGGKIATLVAGYNAADTTAAATSLVTNKPETDTGDKYIGDSTGALTKK